MTSGGDDLLLKSILTAITVILVLTVPASGTAGADINEYIQTPLPCETEAVVMINDIRASHGLAELEFDIMLSAAARVKVSDMVHNSYFSHTSPHYGTPFEMMRRFGITYRCAGENLARGYTGAVAVACAWMESPSHRENMLFAAYAYVGVAYEDGYWCLLFRG